MKGRLGDKVRLQHILDAINEPKQINYYQKNDFAFLMESDKESKTRLMYFDLISLN